MRSSDKILIVEDDPAILELLRTRLDLAGYGTAFARDGQAALAAIPKIHPDAIILDINLPKLDGFEVLRWIRTTSRFKKIPVLMLTARNNITDVQTALLNGAQDYLSKPFDDAVLLARIAKLLRHRGRAAETPACDSGGWVEI